MKANKAPTLEPAVSGQRTEFTGKAGNLSYYTAGDGTPLLLVHSINAAASAAEIAPLYEGMLSSHRVFAPDLPGFGFSERSDRDYTPRLYTDAVLDMLDEIGTDPVDAVALSLSGEFVARAAAEHPERFRSLTLVTPTGFRADSDRLRKPPGSTRYMPLLDRVLTFALWKRRLFAALTSPKSIRYFLGRTWGSSGIDQELAAYCDASSHQPGAEHAPFAFLSGRLFSTDIRNVYEALELPVWLPHGTRGDFTDFRGADWTVALDNWRLQPYDSGALPHFEHTDTFLSDLRRFLEDPAAYARS